MKNWFTGVCVMATQVVWAQNNAPQVSGLTAVADTLNNTVTLTFSLSDTENDSLDVSVAVSDDMGLSYMISPQNLSGNVGFPQFQGGTKQIVWNYSGFNSAANQFRIKVVADDRKHVSVQDMVNQVDSMRLLYDMSLIEGVRTHTVGSAHLQQVSDTIYNRFAALGLSPGIQSFTFGGFNGGNIIAQTPGVTHEAEVYIIDGHFDGVSAGPAADDNASAVIGVLEAARILSQYRFKRTIRFIAFDMEELGLVGSNRYVNNAVLPAEQIKGVLNFEMIGYYSQRNNSQIFPAGFGLLFPAAEAAVAADTFKGNFITNVANINSSPLRQKFDQCAATYVPGLRVISLEAPGNSEIAPDLRRSDHASFWDKGYQALMLTDGANFRNQNYHTANDVSDSLNFTFIRRVVMATLATAAELAGPVHVGEAFVDVNLPDVSTSLNGDMAAALKLKIIPNPADDKLTLSWAPLHTVSEVRVYTLSGILIQRTVPAAGASQLFMETAAWQPGMYLIQLRGEGWNKSEKVLIQH